MDPKGELSNNTQLNKEQQETLQLVPQPTAENTQPLVMSAKDIKLAEDEVLYTGIRYIAFAICMLIISTIVSIVLISRVVKWLDDNTKDSSPCSTSAIFFYVMGSLFSFYYLLFLGKCTEEMYDHRSYYKFNYRICPLVFIYLLSWVPRIAVYVDLGLYLSEDKYKSLHSFDIVLFEFIFSILIHLICHILHFIPIVIYFRKMTIYRLRNNNLATCESFNIC